MTMTMTNKHLYSATTVFHNLGLVILAITWISPLTTTLTTTITSSMVASATNIHGWQPSISLTNDLDEPDKLGFCIDIVGFGDGIDCSRLQAHSCKPSGADTQFAYDASTQSIRAVNYNADCDAFLPTAADSEACVAVVGERRVGATLGLVGCDEEDGDNDSRMFGLEKNDDNSYELRSLGADDDTSRLCLVVSDTTRQANRYVARNLFLGDCDATPNELKLWTILPDPGVGGNTASEVTPAPKPTLAPSLVAAANFSTGSPVSRDVTTNATPSSETAKHSSSGSSKVVGMTCSMRMTSCCCYCLLILMCIS